MIEIIKCAKSMQKKQVNGLLFSLYVFFSFN